MERCRFCQQLVPDIESCVAALGKSVDVRREKSYCVSIFFAVWTYF